ncbi:nuclear receptor-binding protein isoform X2 [Exaiptasia diaphana]|uniref:Nuclear receptor-binding protein homolog n=1 Tax=Exaiptasia diaphana TaxID=2652724 RepID=A0A913YK23_EXADI|nr:nuclear receptor-binding protein isoform X2 [Exaiptasia diaphana]KXJ13209.1 Nuclear receptor-binding protein [Exaiptasia diaphana]
MASSLAVADPSVEHSGDESEDDDDVVEQSPCGRWEKRRQEVMQRDVPGIDHAYLAMDTEEGVEVVWNEVQFSERKDFKSQEETIKKVFENLIQLDHPNIVKFHMFWTDVQTDKARVIFITEYMTSGSLKQFLKRTRKSDKTLNVKVWKRWCRQILSALSYLHGCDIPIVHGNLSCDTIFIQHNGLIKIGSVAPDTIHNHVKTCREEKRNMHFIAPEYGIPGHIVDCAVDVYAFGMCALEMAALELHFIEGPVSKNEIEKAIQGLDSSLQRDFIKRCLAEDPTKRPNVQDLLLDPCLFEVHSLKLLAGHCMVDHDVSMPDNGEKADPEKVIAVYKAADGTEKVIKNEKGPVHIELDKFLEEVRNGLYPLTGIEKKKKLTPRQRPKSPDRVQTVQKSKHDTESYDEESRRFTGLTCEARPLESGDGKMLSLLIKFEERMNRQLSCEVKQGEKGSDLADELVKFGFINKKDHEAIAIEITKKLYPS